MLRYFVHVFGLLVGGNYLPFTSLQGWTCNNANMLICHGVSTVEAIRIIAIVELFVVFVLISGKKIYQFMSYRVFMQISSIYPIFELIPRRWKKFSFSAYWQRSKCLVCFQHFDLWSWMRALFWYTLHHWSVQIFCIATAQGGWRCLTSHMVKIELNSS